MRLQSIVFSLSENLNVNELYTEIDSNVLVMDYNQARILPKGILDTGTYFNSLSVRKWKEYTKIDKIKLKGKLSGNFRFEVYERRMIKSILQEECIYSHEFDFVKEECIDIELDLHHYDSMCFVRIKANSETIVKDLHYYSDYSVNENVNIATVICTFKREAYIERNIELMGKRLIGNNRSALQNHLDIIVVDNGQTLNLNYKKIKLIKNRNTGGTGGFTRGIIEVLNHQKDKKYTHVLLMDDDVCIEPESIERTYSMLSLLKECYKKTFIGGAMLRQDEPCVQEEAGATWDGVLHSMGKDYDLRKVVNVLKNDEIYPVDYNGWWYCCMPISELGFDNLPLPFFIHLDDVEYGLRNSKNWIHLNGICVWHEVAGIRKNDIRDYYDVRNLMILNILYSKRGYSCWKLTKALIIRLLAGLLLPNLSFPMRVNAMKDFFRGAEWWAKQEIDVLHQEVKLEKVRTNIKDILLVCLKVIFLPVIYNKHYIEYRSNWRSLTNLDYWKKYQVPLVNKIEREK